MDKTEGLKEFFVSGFVEGETNSQSVLFLEDEKRESFLLVWLSNGEDRLVRDQLKMKPSISGMYNVCEELFSSLDVTIRSCIFTGVSMGSQNVMLTYEKKEPGQEKSKLEWISVNAGDCMSFCLAQKVRFWCPEEVLEECQDLTEESFSSRKRIFVDTSSSENKQKYLM